MKLQEGEYIIPEGCTVKRVGCIIQIYKSKRGTLASDDYRCKDCVHYVKGYSSNSRWYQSIICDMKPKRVGEDGITMYHAAQKYEKPCVHFKLREQVK